MEVRDLHKGFGSTAVLDGLNLPFPAGAVTAVLGPSGVGKSVLVKHLIGLLEPDDGEVGIEGTDIWRVSAKERTRNPIMPEARWAFRGDYYLSLNGAERWTLRRLT